MLHILFIAPVKLIAHLAAAHGTATVATQAHGVAAPHAAALASTVAGHSLAAQPLTTPIAPFTTPIAHQATTAVVPSALLSATHSAALASPAAHSKLIAVGLNHAELMAAKEAGRAVASGAVAGKVVTPVVLTAMPIHYAVAGSAAAAGSSQLSPTTVAKAKKLAAAFAQGFAMKKIQGERTRRLDQRNVKGWFQQESKTTGPLMFTATGKIKSGNFVPAPPAEYGPYVVLQGLFDPKIAELRSGRVIRGVESMSGSLLNGHRVDGVSIYAPLKVA